MKRIYKANMRNLVVKDLEINADGVKILEYEKPVVKRELTFYVGFMGSYISFEYGTRLPDEYEAMDYVKESLNNRQDKTPPYPECTFVDESEMTFSHEICDKNFKVLKKYYRRMRKEERQAQKKKY